MGFSTDNSGSTQFANIRAGQFVQQDGDDKNYFNTFSGCLEGIRLREREYEGNRFTDLELKFWDGHERTILSGTAFRNGKIQLWAWMLLDRLLGLATQIGITPDRVAQPIELTIKVWPNDFLGDDGNTHVATSCTVEHAGVKIDPLHNASSTPMDERVLLAAEGITFLQNFFPSFGKTTEEAAQESSPDKQTVPLNDNDLPF